MSILRAKRLNLASIPANPVVVVSQTALAIEEEPADRRIAEDFTAHSCHSIIILPLAEMILGLNIENTEFGTSKFARQAGSTEQGDNFAFV